MRRSKGLKLPPKFKVEGSVFPGGTKLRWKPVARAKVYAVEWLGKDREWTPLWMLEGEEIAPNDDGVIEYVDGCSGSMGPGGTYRVVAYFNLDFEGRRVVSPPVVLTANKPTRLTLARFARRIQRKKWPSNVKLLIQRLKWSGRGL